jgi:hypothetical protein
LVPIFVAFSNKLDDDLLAVTQQKMTWGEYARRARDQATETNAAIRAQDQRVVAGLQHQHRAELAERQRALDSLAAWAETQQLIDAVNRPVVTNCSGFGNMVNCVSR